LVLHPGARVNRFEEKAAFTPSRTSMAGHARGEPPRRHCKVRCHRPDREDAAGWNARLDAAAGDWVVLRFGYSLLGITNHPATAEATGLEVDKLDRRYVKKYMDTYLDSYKETVGADLMGKRGIRYVINDSWEAGSQNWTDNMIAAVQEAARLRSGAVDAGAGRQVVESAEASDKFLWDFRKTIADLIANEHYGQLEATLHERGMGHYGESHESGRAFVADGMEVKKFNEVPMSAMWTQTARRQQRAVRLQRGRSRVGLGGAHLRPEPCRGGVDDGGGSALGLVAGDAEAHRRPGVSERHQPLCDSRVGAPAADQQGARHDAWTLRPVVQSQRDLGGAGGPLDRLPGAQQLPAAAGHFGADLIYFYGEDSNLTAIFRGQAPDVPAGYGFDYINADALIHELSAERPHHHAERHEAIACWGSIPTASTCRCRCCAPFTNWWRMARWLPARSPSTIPAWPTIRRSSKLNDELFGDGTGVHRSARARSTPARIWRCLQRDECAPDFDYTKPESDTRLLFVHRKLADGDLYFVDNRNDRTNGGRNLPRNRQGAGTVARRHRQIRARVFTRSRTAAPRCR
jgi:hypothetical protein